MKFIFIFLTVPRGCPVICGQLKTDFPIPAALFVLYTLDPDMPANQTYPLKGQCHDLEMPYHTPPPPPVVTG